MRPDPVPIAKCCVALQRYASPDHNFASSGLDVSTGQPRDPAERRGEEACRNQQPCVSQCDPLRQSLSDRVYACEHGRRQRPSTHFPSQRPGSASILFVSPAAALPDRNLIRGREYLGDRRQVELPESVIEPLWLRVV